MLEGDHVPFHRELDRGVVLLLREASSLRSHDYPGIVRVLKNVIHSLLNDLLVLFEWPLEENMFGEAKEPSRDWNVFDNALDKPPRIAKAAELFNHQPPDKPIDFVAVIYKGEVMLLSQHVKDVLLTVDNQLRVWPVVDDKHTL